MTQDYCPGFDLWDVPTANGNVRVAADNADGARFVCGYVHADPTGPAVYVSANPAALAWQAAR